MALEGKYINSNQIFQINKQIKKGLRFRSQKELMLVIFVAFV